MRQGNSGVSVSVATYMVTTATELERFRSEKDHFFAHNPDSPLSGRQRQAFQGLAYFPDNPQLTIHAVIDRNVEPGVVRMATTGGIEQVYRRYGVVRFEVDGQPAQVTLYATEPAHTLFVPFRDATSGRESYGAGRYLDVHPHGDHVTIDFNYAYNPSCAYDPSWSCPLPPAENWLKVPIRAGERIFPDSDSDPDGPAH